MRLAFTFLLALAGCHSVGGVAPADTADPGEGDTDTDTDADTDADADADADADTDADTDVSYEGSYEGDVWAVIEEEWWTEEGDGPFELDINPSGNAEGWASITTGGRWGWEIEGDITGTVDAGAFDGILIARIAEDEVKRIDLQGQVQQNGEIHLEFERTSDWMFIYGGMDGERVQ